jgi:hypothetical protein
MSRNAISVDLSQGNVGIGTTNPSPLPLYVGGNTSFQGDINANNLAMFRNKIINGNFDIWQRGTSFNITAANTFTADRWFINYDGSGATRTTSRQAFTLGQTDVPDEPTYFLRANQSVAGSGGNYNTLHQRIESVRTLAGKTITVSFYAKADTSRNITFNINQFFGSGGSPSSTVFIQSPTFSLTTNWNKYQYTLSIPSIAGKTIGTYGDDFLEISINFPINTTFTIDIAQVQVEKGTIATPFELRPIGLELQLCMRYYQIVHFTLYAYVANLQRFAGAIQDIPIFPMRIAPLYNILSSNSSNWTGGTPIAQANATYYARMSALTPPTVVDGFWEGVVSLTSEI